MDHSRQNIDLFPERRRKTMEELKAEKKNEQRSRTETSRFFEPLRSKRKKSPNDNDEDETQSDDDTEDVQIEWSDSDEEFKTPGPPQKPSEEAKARGQARQTVLTFTKGGQLSTKAPSKHDLTNPISRLDVRRKALSAIAHETLLLLPGLLATRPDVSTEGYLCKDQHVGPLDPKYHPHLPLTAIKIVNSDTIDAALSMSSPSTTFKPDKSKPVCVLNMANATHRGGGFRRGALAQEEAICYRSSLYFTLKKRHYPLPEESAIYSPTVLVIRESSITANHELCDFRDPRKLGVVTVVSCAAVCRPDLTKTSSGAETYKDPRDRAMMKVKMRVILRTMIRNRHRRVVLGAFGCGAFWNPPVEVAEMWRSVLTEKEFAGGWWEEVVFAVLDLGGSDNFRVFKGLLDGLRV